MQAALSVLYICCSKITVPFAAYVFRNRCILMREIWNNIDVTEVVREVNVRLIEGPAPGLGVFADYPLRPDFDDPDSFVFLEEKVTDVVNEEISRLA
jgi:hypothetical protein